MLRTSLQRSAYGAAAARSSAPQKARCFEELFSSSKSAVLCKSTTHKVSPSSRRTCIGIYISSSSSSSSYSNLEGIKEGIHLPCRLLTDDVKMFVREREKERERERERELLSCVCVCVCVCVRKRERDRDRERV
jgi:hypothetical protein